MACHVLYQEIADVLAGLGHLEGLTVENQEIADVLAGLYKGGETKQICQSTTDHGDVKMP